MNIDDLQKAAAKKINIEELIGVNSELLTEIQNEISEIQEDLIIKTENDFIDYFQKKNFSLERQRLLLRASYGDFGVSLSLLKRNSNFVQLGLTVVFNQRKDYFIFLRPEKRDFYIPFLISVMITSDNEIDQLKQTEKKLLEEHLKLKSIKEGLRDLKFEFSFAESEQYSDSGQELPGYRSIMDILNNINSAH